MDKVYLVLSKLLLRLNNNKTSRKCFSTFQILSSQKKGEKEEETPGESKKRMTKKRKIVSKKAAARALLVEREGTRSENLRRVREFY